MRLRDANESDVPRPIQGPRPKRNSPVDQASRRDAPNRFSPQEGWGPVPALDLQRLVGNTVVARALSRSSDVEVMQRVGPKPEDVQAEIRVLLAKAYAFRIANPAKSGWTFLEGIQGLIEKAILADPANERAILTDPVKTLIRDGIAETAASAEGRIGTKFLRKLFARIGEPVTLLRPLPKQLGEDACGRFDREAVWGNPMVAADHIEQRHHAKTFYSFRQLPGAGDTTNFFPLAWSVGSLLPRLKAVMMGDGLVAVQTAFANGLDWFRVQANVDGYNLIVSGGIRADGVLPPRLRVNQFFPSDTRPWSTAELTSMLGASPTWADFETALKAGGQP